MSQNSEMMDLFEDTCRKINIARLALDKAISETEGEIGFDVATGILELIKKAHEAMEELSGPINNMSSEHGLTNELILSQIARIVFGGKEHLSTGQTTDSGEMVVRAEDLGNDLLKRFLKHALPAEAA